MTLAEARLRSLFQELAEDAQPTALLSRLDDRAPLVVRRRRLAVSVVAVAVACAVAVSTAVVQTRTTSMPQPTDSPPQVFELAATTSVRPGTAGLAVTMASALNLLETSTPAYVVPAGGTAVVAVPPSAETRPLSYQRLSADGSHLVRLSIGSSPVEVLDLATGEITRLDVEAVIGEIAPDNRTIAVYLDGDVRLLDIATGGARASIPVARHRELDSFAPALGWSPDGDRLAVNDQGDLVIVDRLGRREGSRAQMHLVNGSQSWSPDSRSLLVFDVELGGYVVQPVDDVVHPVDDDGQPVDGGRRARVVAPPDATRPLGWAGDRVVWLAGEAGDQQLVTADLGGGDPETWLRFEVGDRPVESVTWSRDLSG